MVAQGDSAWSEHGSSRFADCRIPRRIAGHMTDQLDSPAPAVLSAAQRYLVLAAAFLGWMFGGTQMGITTLVMRSAASDLLVTADETLLKVWVTRYVCSFLLGAAAGGLLFGWIGDRIGRARALGLAVLCYSLVTALAFLAQTPEQLLVIRFIACLGVGGVWPNGVALASEAWSDASRPMLAGLIGASANVGLMLTGLVDINYEIGPENWRWVMVVGATPALLGLFVLLAVPESPRWLAQRDHRTAEKASTPAPSVAIGEVFRPPLLWVTLVGICLGTIPLLGGWGSVNWLIIWADKVGADVGVNDLKGWTQLARSGGGTIGSLLGGWIATRLGRRTSYFLISLGALVLGQFIFYTLDPSKTPLAVWFVWITLLGFVATIYFGWLPLFLPELFPTRARATGAGVSFNFGRILAAGAVLLTGVLIKRFDSDYSQIGQITSLIFAVGMVVIWFAPDTSQRKLDD